jgi:hypothetical protein
MLILEFAWFDIRITNAVKELKTPDLTQTRGEGRMGKM